MKQFFLILFCIYSSINCSLYIAAEITFTYLAHYMPSHELFIRKNVLPDALIKMLEKDCFVDMQCNVIDPSEGSLRLNIKPIDHPEKEMKAIIPLCWGKPVEYKDDLMSVLCTVHKLSK